MRYLQFFALVLWMFSLAVLAADGDKNITYYESGATQFEYNYLNGKLNGVSREYYDSGDAKVKGELRAELTYRDGKLEAKKEYLRNGKLSNELRIADGKRYETQLAYYSGTDVLFRERHLVDGKLHGLEQEYYQDGKTLKAERNYVDGKKQGKAKGFHSNGNLQGDWDFAEGLPVKAVIFYRSGEKWLEHSHFLDGRLNGVSKEYDKKGNLIAHRLYEDDRMVKRDRVTGLFDWLFGWILY
jgi:antitoxin component YwqK of YwqJK toxin-antitoxin module